MKKFMISIVIVAAIAIVLGTASFVYAQTTTPPTPVPGAGFGRGMMNGQGYQGSMMGGLGPRGPMANSTAGAQVGFLHDEMIDAYAQKLGISVDELNTRLANGETMAQIASSKGLTADQFRTMMTDARSQAIDQAVKNGDLTQEQADWMKQRGAGMAAGGRGMRGAGLGWNVNPDCPYYSQTNP